MLFRPNPSSGVPIYLQLMEQVKHSIETGALRPGEQLPGIRPLAEELVINPNTVAKAYRELEHEGVIELRHGAGAFVSGNARAKKLTDKLRAGQAIVAAAVEQLRARGVTDEEIRRLFEAELAGLEQDRRAPWLTRSSSKPPTCGRHYDGVEALRGLNLQVPAGSIYGFLGRNGAGKTTTIKVLLGMARPTSGRARVFGLPADAPEASVDIRRRTGFVSEDKDLYDYMTVDGDDPLHAPRSIPRWRADLEQRYLRAVRAAARTGRSRRCRAACAPSSRCCWRSAAAPNC